MTEMALRIGQGLEGEWAPVELPRRLSKSSSLKGRQTQRRGGLSSLVFGKGQYTAMLTSLLLQLSLKCYIIYVIIAMSICLPL